MPVDLQITLGQVNYTGYIHVIAAKVASPSVPAYEIWIPGPLPANYNFVIPNLDPDNYWVSYYDSPDNVSLGTFVAKGYVKATNPEFAYELRFYTIGALPAGATLDVTNRIITDPYLVNRTIESYFKESFRFLEPLIDVSYTSATGDVALLTGADFEIGEKFTITIKYAVGSAPANTSGLYKGSIDIPDAVYTILAADRNKKARLVGTAATQVITMCALSLLAVDDGFYFDNTCGGTAVQVKLLMNGIDLIRFSGFKATSDVYVDTHSILFAEFWVSRGEHLLIRKLDDEYWEIILDYKGVNVGNRMAAGYIGMPGWHAEDGALSDGDEYSRVWFWLTSLLPNTQVITDDAVTGGGYTHPVGQEGLFVKHSTLKKFRWPNTQGLSEKGLKNFNSYGLGTDATRIYNYPGGKQLQAILSHGHRVNTGGSGGSSDPGKSLIRQAYNGDGYGSSGTGIGSGGPYIEVVGDTEQKVNNVGYIYMRHI